MPYAATRESGTLVAFPDVCWTPGPGGPELRAYRNTAQTACAAPVTRKVLVCGVPALTKASRIQPTEGDQEGTGGGVVSRDILGPACFLTGSAKVRFEGRPAVFQGCLTLHNGGNALGVLATPSQTKVTIRN